MTKKKLSLLSTHTKKTQIKVKHRLPFGVQLKDVVSIMALIGTGQTNPCRLFSTGSAGVASKHSLSLHITL